MNAAAWMSTIAGIGLLGLVGLDIYRTILNSRGHSGPVTEMLTRSVWRLVRGAAFHGGRFVGLGSIFADAARDLQGLLESHIEHPLIHYFHPRHVHKSLPVCSFWCWKSAR